MRLGTSAVVLLCALAAGGGIALFVASLDVRESSLARAAALPFVAWRPREASARPLPDAPPLRADRDQR